MKTLFGHVNARETDEQAAFVEWFRAQFPKVLLYAIPNGASLAGDVKARSIQMARMKREGLVPGVPDLSVPAWGPLWIEMKRLKNSTLTDAQIGVHAYLRGVCGQTVIVARGCDDAIKQLLEWRGQV